eukprot:scaffold4566_cov118-Isochrysis_galbana.AAC.3
MGEEGAQWERAGAAWIPQGSEASCSILGRSDVQARGYAMRGSHRDDEAVEQNGDKSLESDEGTPEADAIDGLGERALRGGRVPVGDGGRSGVQKRRRRRQRGGLRALRRVAPWGGVGRAACTPGRGPEARALTCASFVSLRQLDRRRNMVCSRQTRGASGHDTEKKAT